MKGTIVIYGQKKHLKDHAVQTLCKKPQIKMKKGMCKDGQILMKNTHVD